MDLSIPWYLKWSTQSFPLETSFFLGLMMQDVLGFLPNTLSAPCHSLLQNSPPSQIHFFAFHPQLALFLLFSVPEVCLFLPLVQPICWQLSNPLSWKASLWSPDSRCSYLQGISTLSKSTHKCTIFTRPKLLFFHSAPCPHDPPMARVRNLSPQRLHIHLIWTPIAWSGPFLSFQPRLLLSILNLSSSHTELLAYPQMLYILCLFQSLLKSCVLCRTL